MNLAERFFAKANFKQAMRSEMFRARQQPRPNPLIFEPLEPRILLSADVLPAEELDLIPPAIVVETSLDLQENQSLHLESSALAGDPPPAANLDLDDNGEAIAAQDGLLFLRYAFGLRGQSLVEGVVDQAGNRNDAASIVDYLDAADPTRFDVDDNGSVRVLSDGLLIARYLDGLRGADLIQGVVDLAGNRTDATDIEAYIARLLPDFLPPDITATLANDTGQFATDGLTSDPTIIGVVTEMNPLGIFQATLFDAEGMTALDILPLVQSDGSFQLNVVDLEAIKGAPLIEGFHRLQLLAKDEQGNLSDVLETSFILDRIGPILQNAPGGILSETFSAFTLEFNEAVSPEAFAAVSYSVEVSGGPNAGQNIPIISVEQVDVTTAELHLGGELADQDYTFTITGPLFDLAGQPFATPAIVPFTVLDPAAIAETSPLGGEEMVNLTRETIVRFDEAIDPTTITEENVYLIAQGERVPGRLQVSSTERFVTLFYDNALPASTEVRLVVDGDSISGQDGHLLDADGDGVPGGVLTADFRTLPLTRIPGTNVFGYVFDSVNVDAEGNNIPIVGATIRVDAFPEANVVTDENGFFLLQNMPAPEFFVHIDGSTAINAPAGTVYPNVGKPFHSVPGQEIQIEKNLQPFDIFLPPIAQGDIQLLSPTEATQVGFGPGGVAELQEMFPAIDPAMWEVMQVTFEAGSAIDDQGNPATQAAIIPVPPNRLPAPLPPGVVPQLVLSIQAEGATNFDVPAQVTFPNVDGLNPGDSSLIWSFDHDAGNWKVIGAGTVTSDGMAIVSDPGVGILAPGWYLTQPGIQLGGSVGGNAGGGGNEGDPPHDPNDPRPKRQLVNAGSNALNFGLGAFSLGTSIVTSTLGTENSGIGRFAGALTIAIDLVGFIDDPTILGGVSLFFSGIAIFPTPLGLAASLARTGIGIYQMSDALQKVGEELNKAKNLGQEWSLGSGITSELVDGSAFSAAIHEIDFLLNELNVQSEIYLNMETNLSMALAIMELGDPEAPDLGLDVEQQMELQRHLELSIASMQAIEGRIWFVDGLRDLLPLIQAAVDEIMAPFADPVQGAVVAVQVGNLNLQTTTDADGKWRLVVPENEFYTGSVYLPAQNLIGEFSGFSGDSLTLDPNTGFRTVTDSGRSYLAIPDETFLDTDGDGLVDLAEITMGTSLDNSDTDDDGISDLSEIQQGLNPLDDRGFPTGIISRVPLNGPAMDIIVEGSLTDEEQQTAYIATGFHGLAIVDVSQFDNPIVLGQLDLPGAATGVSVDTNLEIAVVASGEGGVHLIDVSNPMFPQLFKTVALIANNVEVADGFVYAAVGDTLVLIDLLTGVVQGQHQYVTGPIDDMAISDGFLYFVSSAHASTHTVSKIELIADPFEIIDQITMDQFQILDSLSIFAGGGLVYLAPVDSANTMPGLEIISDGTNGLELIGEPSDINVFDVVVNGSGIAIFAGLNNPEGADLGVLDVSDPTQTDRFLTSFLILGGIQDIAIGGGIAFVAGNPFGLHVVNYLPFDGLGVAPTISLSHMLDDIDPNTNGIQIFEGAPLALRADVEDDVQARNVEWLVNGEVVRQDVSFPWDFLTSAPIINGASSLTVQARATDTGGNSALSNILSFELVEDTVAPSVVGTFPLADGAVISAASIDLTFNEALDDDQLDVAGVTILNLGADGIVGGGDDLAIDLSDLVLRNRGQLLSVIPQSTLIPGNYLVTIDQSILADLAGNHVTEALTLSFEIGTVDSEAEFGIPLESDLPSANVGQSIELGGGNITLATQVVFPSRDLDGGETTIAVLPSLALNEAEKLQVIVPDEARTGIVTLSGGGGSFPLQIVPVITGINGQPGIAAPFELIGTGFQEGVSTVTIGGLTLVDQFTNDDQIDVAGSLSVVAPLAVEGPIRVTTDGGYFEFPGPTFPGQPVVEFLSLEASADEGLPADPGQPSANTGQSILLHGQGFSNQTLVQFEARDDSGFVGTLTRTGEANGDGTQLSVDVPALAQTGLVRVLGSPIALPLQIVPTLRSVGGAIAPGTQLVLEGTGLSDGNLFLAIDGEVVSVLDVKTIVDSANIFGPGLDQQIVELTVPNNVSNGVITLATSGGSAILRDGVPITMLPDLVLPDDVGDTLATAQNLGLTGNSQVRLRSVVGDTTLGPLDVDLFSFSAQADDALSFAGIPPSTGLTEVRVFNDSGVELFHTTIIGGTGVSSEDEFVAPGSGNYYLGVSGLGNVLYDPTAAGSGSVGSIGIYDVEMTLSRLMEIAPVIASVDVGDTLSTASLVNLPTKNVVTVSAAIGDSVLAGAEVDLFAINLGAGDGLTVELESNFLDSVLRVFDDTGFELAIAQDELDFQAPAAGIYYVGVSGLSNFAYDPTILGSGVEGETGMYALTLIRPELMELPDLVPPVDIGGTTATALVQAVPLNQQIRIDAVIGDNGSGDGDVDLYQVDLSAGDVVFFEVETTGLNPPSSLAPVLRVFDHMGIEVGFGFDFFSAEVPDTATYYVGVSGEGNDVYNPLNGANSVGGSLGAYALMIGRLELTQLPDIFTTVDTGETLGTAMPIALPGNSEVLFSAAVGDGPLGGADVDVLSFSGLAGEIVNVTTLSVRGVPLSLRLFNQAGTELAANGDGLFGSVSVIDDFVVPADGTYFVGISGWPNMTYDPILGGGGSVGDADGYMVLLERMSLSTLPDFVIRMDVGDTLGTAQFIDLPLNHRVTLEGMVGDTIFDGRDVDFFQVTASAGEILSIRVPADGPSFFSARAFDLDGTLLAIVSSGGMNTSMRIPDSGTVFIGVSGTSNSFYDPMLENSGINGDKGLYTVALQLIEEGSLTVTNIIASAVSGIPARPGLSSANVGQVITLEGSGLTSADRIVFTTIDPSGEVQTQMVSPTMVAGEGSRLDVVVPDFAATGMVRLERETVGQFLQVIPTLTDVEQLINGPFHDEPLILTGSGFTEGVLAVHFDDQTLIDSGPMTGPVVSAIFPNANSELFLVVPNGVPTGPIQVMTLGGTSDPFDPVFSGMSAIAESSMAPDLGQTSANAGQMIVLQESETDHDSDVFVPVLDPLKQTVQPVEQLLPTTGDAPEFTMIMPNIEVTGLAGIVGDQSNPGSTTKAVTFGRRNSDASELFIAAELLSETPEVPKSVGSRNDFSTRMALPVMGRKFFDASKNEVPKKSFPSVSIPVTKVVQKKIPHATHVGEEKLVPHSVSLFPSPSLWLQAFLTDHLPLERV